MSTDDPQWASEKLRVLEQRRGESKGRIEKLKAKHHAASMMNGDRRYRTLRSIEEHLRKEAEYLDKMDRAIQKLESPTKPSMRQGSLNYRSREKRAIFAELTKNPNATDLEVCRALDEDGFELPDSLKSGGNRLFDIAYKGNGKHRLEIIISKVRTDMREKGLMTPRSR